MDKRAGGNLEKKVSHQHETGEELIPVADRQGFRWQSCSRRSRTPHLEDSEKLTSKRDHRLQAMWNRCDERTEDRDLDKNNPYQHDAGETDPWQLNKMGNLEATSSGRNVEDASPCPAHARNWIACVGREMRKKRPRR